MPGFDRAADIYDQTRGFPPGVGDRVAAALVDFVGLKPDDRILEIGVGTGRIAKPLAVALDPPPRCVSRSRPTLFAPSSLSTSCILFANGKH